ncbi:hypothetical protein evm_002026 [Chilo suppressalis]|nr:hypothetical protein evm_002026 [Chilo suppressalis]
MVPNRLAALPRWMARLTKCLKSKMALLIVTIFAAACLSASGFPQEPLSYRTTIFGDERLEDGPFEFLNTYNEVSSRDTNNPYRLPTTTKPENYKVNLVVNMTDLSFSGDVEIRLYATQWNVNEIIIHAHDMNITSLELKRDNNPIYQTYELQPQYHFLRVRLTSEPLAYNVSNRIIYTLAIKFEAELRSDMTGLYRNWYRNNATDDPSWMASTHLQATTARFVFPCYDEPSFKATFDMTITRPESFGSWFCTKRNDTRTSSIVGYKDDIYSTTPVMSTYLLAVIVAEYTSKTKEANNGDLLYEVIARPAAMEDNQGDYAFYFGQDLLEEMSRQTDIEFYSVNPNLKMTQAAIPDFSAGAMENWGLLVYREAYLMYHENHTDGFFKQRIAYILSHEIAHMWFGNLVTCDWWDNLWLNEGFARYYQYYLTDWVDPELGLATRFIPEQVHSALLTDSANNPHPLNNPGLGSPVEVRTMFTQISYNKGAAVIRMTEHLMGFNNHREGLRRYLREREFNTALPIHLFQALQDSAVETGAIAEYGSDFNIIDYYRTWSDQGGHPVLNVEVNHQTGEMTILQRRFNINSGYSTSNTNWIVPITFATASNPDFEDTKPSHIIKDSITRINRGSIGDEWVIFNKQQTGFYRVNYDDYTWDLIIMLLRGPNRTLVHEFNRAQIVNDVFQFARSGLMNYTRAFNILSFMKYETEYAPWAAAITGFNWVRNRFMGTPTESRLNALFIEWATPVMQRLTYYPRDDESFMTSYLRYQLAPVMCQLEVDECRQAATQQFEELKINSTEVPVDSRNWVYCNALRKGVYEDFDFLWRRFISHPVYGEKIQIIMILGCTPDAIALNKFLDNIIEPDNFIIRRQDYTTAFNSAVSGNENNTQIVFQYIQDNLRNVSAALGTTTALSYISSRLRTYEAIKEFQEWADENQAALGADYQAVYNGAVSSSNAIEWAAAVQDDVNSYLTTGDSVVQPSTPAPEPINVPTAGAQAFPMDGIGRLGHDPPRGPSADWWADAAGTNGLTCLPKHGGTRDRRFLVTHPMTDHCESCLTSTIAAERANHLRHRDPHNTMMEKLAHLQPALVNWKFSVIQCIHQSLPLQTSTLSRIWIIAGAQVFHMDRIGS